jgi:hypothetical protein
MSGAASTEVDKPLAEVWALVEAVELAPDWQGGLDELTPIERDEQGRPTLVETRTDAKVRQIVTRVRFDYSGAPRRLQWRQEKGDLKSLVGAWALEEIDAGRTRVTYELDGDPGRVLGMLIRGPVESRLREILVGSRPGELKARIEG